jgi:hypothetical protein
MSSVLELQLHDQLVSIRLHVSFGREYVIKAGMVHRLRSGRGLVAVTSPRRHTLQHGAITFRA